MGGCAAGALLAVAGSTGARAATSTTASSTASDDAALQAAISDLSHPPATSAQLRVDPSSQDFRMILEEARDVCHEAARLAPEDPVP
ncbi:hypothetical protein ACWEWX_11120, partial [Streptomyces asiaticus]